MSWLTNDLTDQTDSSDDEWVKRCATKSTLARERTSELTKETLGKMLLDLKKDEDVRNMEIERDAAYVGIAMDLLDLIMNKLPESAEKAGGDEDNTMKVTALAAIMKTLMTNAEEFKRM